MCPKLGRVVEGSGGACEVMLNSLEGLRELMVVAWYVR